MLPVRWEPLRNLSKELGTLHREMDELFRRTFGGLTTETGIEHGGFITPAIDTYTKGDTYFVEAEIPGVEKSDLDVSIDGNVLTLRGERKLSKETKEEDFFIREAQYGSFIRRLTLPEGVNTEKVAATYENGILRITMPVAKKLPSGRKVMIMGPTEGKAKGEVH